MMTSKGGTLPMNKTGSKTQVHVSKTTTMTMNLMNIESTTENMPQLGYLTLINRPHSISPHIPSQSGAPHTTISLA